MTAKRSRVTHVPDDGEVIPAPSSSSRLDRASPNTTKKPVTVATLAQEIKDLKAQVAIMVEWLETHGDRLDALEDRPGSGD